MALESAGVRDEAFTQAKGKAIRKVAAFDVERAAVLERLENAKAELTDIAEGLESYAEPGENPADRLQKVEDRLLDGPYIHHFVEMQGDYRKEIEEFCKYIPNLKVDHTV